MAVVIDTHAAIWFFGNPERLSGQAAQAIQSALSDGSGVRIATISVVEMIYLLERRRAAERELPRLLRAAANPAVALGLTPLDAAIARRVASIPRDIVADMPDRIIAATALTLSLPLVTRDRALRQLDIETIW